MTRNRSTRSRSASTSGNNSDSGPSALRIAVVVAVIGVIGTVLGAATTSLFGLVDKPPATTPPSATTAASSASKDDRDCIDAKGGTVIINGNANCPPQPETPAPAPAGETADAGCGTLDGPPEGVGVRLKVVMWCAPMAVRGQYQFKLKVSVRNTGTKTLDISRTKFVLLWRSLNPSKWTPPPGGKVVFPRKFEVQGVEAWGIFPNPDGSAELISEAKGPTFATHWAHTSLAPNQRSLKLSKDSVTLQYLDDNREVRRLRYNHHQDDLVFYVPASTVDRDKNFLGLGYVRGDEIIAVCPQNRWGPKVPPNAF